MSQESLDINDDFELNARRTRIRTLRARGALHRAGDRDSETSGDICDMNGDGEALPSSSTAQSSVITGDTVHDSPTRTSAVQRAKDKRTRPNHLQKGKLPKDKRKLREKRRSTGVVHLASTESTGDSLDDDDEEEKLSEAKRNTAYNEVIDADNPQTPSEVMRRIQQFQSLSITTNSHKPAPSLDAKSATRFMAPRGFVSRRNKSPSDLEADLEDNQDYDSCVSQSESNFVLPDQSESRTKDHDTKKTWVSQSKFSSESVQSFKPGMSSRATEGRVPSASHTFQNQTYSRTVLHSASSHSPNSPSSPKSPKSPRSVSQTTNLPVSREPGTVPSVLARYTGRDRPEDVTSTGSYRSRFEDRQYGGVRGPLGQRFASSVNKENRDEDIVRKLEKDLERERDENLRLQRVLEDKDRRIAELERQVAMLNRDLNDCEEDMEKLQIENRALIQAVSQLSRGGTHV